MRADLKRRATAQSQILKVAGLSKRVRMSGGHSIT